MNIELLKVYNFEKKVRYGTNSDGGYVIAELDGGYDCYISAGISNEESFSRDFINKYNLNVKINLITFNPWDGCQYQPSFETTIKKFQDILKKHDILTTLRKVRGQDVLAACGQLKSASIREKNKNYQ